jgi:hypothetical protein
MFKGYYRRNISEKINRLRDYIEFSHELLGESLNRKKEDNSEFLAGIDDEFYREKFGELASEREYEIEFEFSAIHWSSIFITQYSYIEHILDSVCEFYRREANAALSYKDLSGAGIERAKGYISKYMGITSPFEKNEWGKIKNYAKIRNKIIHAGLDINEEIAIDKSIVEIIKKTPSISLNRFLMTEPCDPYSEEDGSEEFSYLVDPSLELNERFLTEVIDDFEAFCEQLFSELEGVQKCSASVD